MRLSSLVFLPFPLFALSPLTPPRFLKKRVILPFLGHGGHRTVAGVHGIVISQRKYLGSHAIDQGVIVPAGEVGAADGPGKEGVADVDVRVIFQKQADAARGMSRG